MSDDRRKLLAEMGPEYLSLWGVATTMTHIDGARREDAVGQIIDCAMRLSRRQALQDVRTLADHWGADPLGLSAASILLGELDSTENKVKPMHEALRLLREAAASAKQDGSPAPRRGAPQEGA